MKAPAIYALEVSLPAAALLGAHYPVADRRVLVPLVQGLPGRIAPRRGPHSVAAHPRLAGQGNQVVVRPVASPSPCRGGPK